MKKLITVIMSLSLALFCMAEPVKKPVVFYLKNLPQERIGEWTDEKIKGDLEAEGYIVIEVDCSSYPKTSPELEEALVQFHINCKNVYSSYENAYQVVDIDNVHYVPEGYTIKKNIPVWNIKDHGADGSLEYIMKQWNNVIVSKHGVDPVTSPEQMTNPDGSPLDYNLYLDIIYPSGNASAKVPLLMNHSSNSPRWRPFAPEQKTEVIYRNMFPIGFLTTGYAFANIDHCFVPLARGETWGYFDAYTLDDWNGLASNTAFVRYLRLHLDQYNLNGKIGTMGISKASYGSTRLSDPNNAAGSEYYMFNSTPNTKPQPWAEGESHVDVIYTAAGHGTSRIDKFVNSGCVPVITSAGVKDEYGQWAVYPKVVKHLNDIDHIHYPFWMQELGHTYPGMGEDFATGESRYVVFKRFYDHFLKPSEQTRADVFCIFPREGADEVDAFGKSRMLPPDNFLPEFMLGLPVDAPLTVRFLEAFAVEAVSAAVTVTCVEDGSVVEGEWTSSMKNTNFSFTPSAPMEKDKTYRITVPVSLSSLSGAHPSAEVVREFTITKGFEASGNVKTHRILPVDDTYTPVALNTTPRGDKTEIRSSQNKYGEWKYYGYLKFDLSEVNTVRMTRITVNLALAAAVDQDIKINAYTTSDEWDEENLVSNNRPTLASSYFAETVVTPSTSWVEIDVTDVVKACLDSGEEHFNMALLVPTSEASKSVSFHSKETAKEDLRPFMSVERSMPSSPTIHVARELEAGQPVKLIVAADYEDEITSVTWYVNDVLSTTDVVTLDAGEYKFKAIVEGPEEVGTDIIVKYIEVK